MSAVPLRAQLSLVVLLTGLSAVHGSSAAALATDAPGSCAAIAARVTAARAADDTGSFAAIFAAASAPASGCDEHSIYCVGQSLALGQLDAAYAASDANRPESDVRALAEAGPAYGSPWQLDAALGDIETAAGQATQSGARFSAAAWQYQQALIALAAPPVCEGEPARPATDQLKALYDHLSAALLLADPLKVATTRCAPCRWLFLADAAGYVPASRPLPITFPSTSDQPTARARRRSARCCNASRQNTIPASRCRATPTRAGRRTQTSRCPGAGWKR